MSNGGSFLVLTNDGRSDGNLLAPRLLEDRIASIRAARRNLIEQARRTLQPGQTLASIGVDDNDDPTVGDIEQTHILFVNAGFKPFVSLGFEYYKVQSANASLNGESQFDLPQYGDFWTDMVAHHQMTSVYSDSWTSPTPGGEETAYGFTTKYPAANKDWDNNTINTGLGVTVNYRLVSPFGDIIADSTANAGRNLVRYCEHPGERLASKVELDINSNPLDAYTYMSSVFHRLFTVKEDKLDAYKRLIGQQTDIVGYSGPKRGFVNDSDYSSGTATATVTPAVALAAGMTATGSFGTHTVPESQDTTTAFTDGVFPDGAGILASAAESDGTSADTTVKNRIVHQDKLVITNGPQTPKYKQPVVNIWTPLHLWSRDIGVAVPSSAIPSGNRQVRIHYCPTEALIHEFPGVFIRQEILPRGLTGATAAGIGPTKAWSASGTADGDTGILDRVPDVIVNYRPFLKQVSSFKTPGGGTFGFKVAPSLYINNVFVNEEIHAIFVRRVGFYLIRVHREQKLTGITAGDSRRFHSFKWPIEYVFIGFLPDHNPAHKLNSNAWRDWHRFCKVYDAVQDERPETGVRVPTATTVANAVGTADVYEVGYSSIGQICPNTFPIEVPVVDTLECKVHEVSLYKAYDEAFYSSYIPYNFGSDTITSPKSRGAMMVNFSQYPGQRQPSGHINLSRAREFYMTWTSTFASSSAPLTMYATGSAINFLLVTDGTANLRYTT